MSDRDKPRRPGSHWGATRRDLVGREHRRPPSHDDELQIQLDLDPELEKSLAPDVVRQIRELADELTPPPVDTNRLPREPTPGESWEHATRVNQRVVNLLAQIAHSSGAGMSLASQVAKLQRSRRITIGISLTALTGVIAGLIAVGTKLYGRGYEAGVDASWKHYIERAVEKNAERLDRLENRRSSRPDYPAPLEPSPKVTP